MEGIVVRAAALAGTFLGVSDAACQADGAAAQAERADDLRHTFAVNSIIAGDDIKTLQENMGHYSAAFTLDRYGHVTETMKRASADRMQVFIESFQNA